MLTMILFNAFHVVLSHRYTRVYTYHDYGFTKQGISIRRTAICSFVRQYSMYSFVEQHILICRTAYIHLQNSVYSFIEKHVLICRTVLYTHGKWSPLIFPF